MRIHKIKIFAIKNVQKVSFTNLHLAQRMITNTQTHRHTDTHKHTLQKNQKSSLRLLNYKTNKVRYYWQSNLML